MPVVHRLRPIRWIPADLAEWCKVFAINKYLTVEGQMKTLRRLTKLDHSSTTSCCPLVNVPTFFRSERIWDYAVIPYEIDANFSGVHKALFKQVSVLAY